MIVIVPISILNKFALLWGEAQLSVVFALCLLMLKEKNSLSYSYPQVT